MLEVEKDWMVLPPELIQIIAKKLPDLLDFIRFRATCKIWRSSAPLSNPPSQFPWFLESLEDRYDHTYGTLSEKPQFYSLSSSQTFSIRLNRSNILQYWIKNGVFSHYLAFADLSEEILSFLNPLTKDLFTPPSPCFDLWASWLTWTGTDPIRDRSIVVVDQPIFIPSEIGRWACYDPHNNKWVEQEGYYYNSCYWQGMFFSTYPAQITEVFDASSKKLLHEIPPPEDELIKNYSFVKADLGWLLRISYLVESLGIILRVSWFYDWDKQIEDSIFHIYMLEFDGLDGQPCWVRVDNIGNQILFLAERNGFSMTARHSTGFREGSIYFINDNKPYVHDILAGTVERVPCPFERCTWFLPSLC